MGGIINMDLCYQCSKDEEEPEPNIVSDNHKDVVLSSKIKPLEIYKEKLPNDSIIPAEITLVKDDEKNKSSNIFDQYMQVSHIADDSLGSIDIVKNQMSGEFRALREIPKYCTFADSENIQKKMILINKLSHRNVAKVIEYYEDIKNYYIIYELGKEYNYNRKFGRKQINEESYFCEFVGKFIIYQILKAVDYLHQNDITYGHINFKNFAIFSDNNNNDNEIEDYNNEESDSIYGLFDNLNKNIEIQKELLTKNSISELSPTAKNFIKELSKYKIKLIDVGIEEAFKRKDITDPIIVDNIEYLNYCSPEFLSSYVGKERDEWACGVLLFFLLTGYFPFESNFSKEVINKIQVAPLNLDTEIFSNISKNCQALLNRLLTKDRTKRFLAHKALESEFFNEGIKIEDVLNFKE